MRRIGWECPFQIYAVDDEHFTLIMQRCRLYDEGGTFFLLLSLPYTYKYRGINPASKNDNESLIWLNFIRRWITIYIRYTHISNGKGIRINTKSGNFPLFLGSQASNTMYVRTYRIYPCFDLIFLVFTYFVFVNYDIIITPFYLFFLRPYLFL